MTRIRILKRPNPILLAAILLLPVLNSMGCDATGNLGVQIAVSDSAGVTIVENSGSLNEAAGEWVVDPNPRLSIGTFQGDSLYQLYQVAGARPLSDGGIAVANGGSGEIRIYDAQGRFARAIGRKGEGPGEFQQPTLVGTLGEDTLVVVDGRLRRISLVHPRMGFLESAPFSDAIGGGSFPQGMMADGTLILGGGFYFSTESGDALTSGFSRRSTMYQSAGLNGEPIAEFGEFPGSEFFMRMRDEGGGAVSMMARLIPFGKHAMQTVGSHWFYYASGDSWEIRAFDTGGDLRAVYRLVQDPRPVRSEDLEALVQEEIEDSGDPSQAPEIRAQYGEMPTPDFMPAFASMYADAEDYLWIERYRGPGEEVPVFDILSPDGALVGQAQLPAGSAVLEIGSDFLLVLQRDELDVEYVRLLELRRPPADAEG